MSSGDYPRIGLIKMAVKPNPTRQKLARQLPVSPVIQSIFLWLNETYQTTTHFLHHRNNFELLIATILSAQCTDAMVNRVTPALFSKFPTPIALATATEPEIQACISAINYFQSKTRYIHQTAQHLLDRYNGEVPSALPELITLPGVGRKTANVIRSQAFGIPAITVDTHVSRVSKRLGLASKRDPDGIEQELMSCLPQATWNQWSIGLIHHGRAVCHARTPNCGDCGLSQWCEKNQIPSKLGNCP